MKKIAITTISMFMLLMMGIASFAALLATDKKLVKSSKYDLDGNGKKDDLTVSFKVDEYGSFEDFYVQVNGKKINESNVFGRGSQVEILDLDKSDKYKEIVLSILSDQDYESMYIYRWDGKKLIAIAGDMEGGRSSSVKRNYVKIEGDQKITTYMTEDLLGTHLRVQEFEIIPISPWIRPIRAEVYDIIQFSGETDAITVKKAFNAYASPKDKKPSIPLKAKDQLILIGSDANEWLQFKNKAGKAIWIKAKKETQKTDGEDNGMYSLIYGYGSMYDYLDGIDFYG